MLRAAATIGDRFELETLARLLDVEEVVLLDAIQEVLDRGLSLEDRGHGIFRLEPPTGAALRQAILPALSEAWHRRLAELFGGLPAPRDGHSECSVQLSGIQVPEPAEDTTPIVASSASRRDPVPSADAECPPTMPEAGACLAIRPDALEATNDGRPASWWERLGAEAANATPAAVRSAPGAAASLADVPGEAVRDDGRSAWHAEVAGMREDAAERHLSAAMAAARAGAHARALDAAGRALARPARREG